MVDEVTSSSIRRNDLTDGRVAQLALVPYVRCFGASTTALPGVGPWSLWAYGRKVHTMTKEMLTSRLEREVVVQSVPTVVP